MNKSDSIKNIGSALLVFDTEMSKIMKSATNPFLKNKYAPLPEILDHIKEPLLKSGLTVKQFPEGENELTTIILHPASGEWIASTYKMNPAKNDPQGEGSRITYQRRYALGACLGLNIDEDDDGNSASARKPDITKTEKKTSTQQTDPRPWINEEQLAKAVERILSGELGEFDTADEFVKKIYSTYRVNAKHQSKIAEAVEFVTSK